MTPGRTPGRRTKARRRLAVLAAALLVAPAGCSDRPAADPAGAPSAAPAPDPSSSDPSAPVTVAGAGDIADDGAGAAATAELIRDVDPDAVFTTGDNAYPDGSPADYGTYYEPTWGAFKDRTRPVPGNHEYETEDAAGYVGYFGAATVANDVDGGLYYAWDVGNGWRAYALNTEISTTGAQLSWLRQDLATHPDRHLVLHAHRPRHTSGEHAPSDDICPLWDALAATGRLEIVLTGHNHQYERFAPMDCAGRAGADGARSFVVGTGGRDLYEFEEIQPGSEFRDNSALGVLRLDLREDSYSWQFLAAGRSRDGTVDTGTAGQVLDEGSAEV